MGVRQGHHLLLAQRPVGALLASKAGLKAEGLIKTFGHDGVMGEPPLCDIRKNVVAVCSEVHGRMVVDGVMQNGRRRKGRQVPLVLASVSDVVRLLKVMTKCIVS